MSNQEDSGSLADAIESVVTRVLNNSVSTSFPATISKVNKAKVNPNTVIVDVVPNLMDLDAATGAPIPDEILDIPLMMVGRTNNFLIRPPTDADSLVGAGVNCFVSSRYLANWRKTGGVVVANDARRFDKADAVAILGLFPDVQSWPFPPKAKTAQMKVLNGTFFEWGNSTVDIPRLLMDILNILQTAKYTIEGVPTPIVYTQSTLQPLNTLSKLTTDLATLANPDLTP